jgi:hypothetical protein
MNLNIKHIKTIAPILTFMMSAAVSAQQPTTGYAPVNGLKMYYEIHGKGDPVVLLHGSFMTITNNWTDMIAQLSNSRQVIAVEMQGHGRTADINRDFSYESIGCHCSHRQRLLKCPATQKMRSSPNSRRRVNSSGGGRSSRSADRS